MEMFKQYLGSPRAALPTNNNNQQQQAQQQPLSILSPRNFLKLITNGLDQFRKTTMSSPNNQNYQQFISTFQPYLNHIREQYQKYQNKLIRKQTKNKNQELEMELKINKIPTKFFMDCNEFKLQICKRSEGAKKQQQLTQYLDEIEVVLFTKAGKYPQKSYIILQNMNHLEHLVNQQIIKVTQCRTILKQKLIFKSQKQLKVIIKQQKINNIRQTLEYVHAMKKIKQLKTCSSTQSQNQDLNKQVLLKFKKSQLDLCHKFSCLQKEMNNIDKYRLKIKEKLYRQFMVEIQGIFNRLLSYNTQEWKNINIPSSIFAGQTDNNVSYNNITILDQSYFAFDTNHINITTNKTPKTSHPQAIREQDEQEPGQSGLSLNKITKQWTIIKEFDMYDEKQVNFQLFNLLVVHNERFNKDMRSYVGYLHHQINQQKEKENQESIFKSGQSYASLKNKNMVRQEDSSEFSQSDEKLASIDMKLYVKVVKFYFQLLKKVFLLIKNHESLQFLQRFKNKYGAFIQQRITYFIQLRQMSHEWKNDDFYSYLQIINYWQNEQFYEIQQFCIKLRQEKIDEYLTLIQKNLLIKELKQNIQSSTYLPVNIGSSNYMPLHYILNNKNPMQEDEMNATINDIQKNKNGGQNHSSYLFRLINKNVFYKNKIYKICDSFLELIRHLEKYVQLKQNLQGYQQNIQEKVCQIIGFYAWYNQKNMLNNKNGTKTLKNYCTFYSTLLFLMEILNSLEITNKKIQKTRLQISQCDAQISKTIMMTPFMMIEERISKIYESKISTRPQIPTPQTQRIIQIVKISLDCLKEYFPIQNEDKLEDSLIVKFTKTTIKLIVKNYFGYLVNMQKRGIAQIKWFLPKLKQLLQITIIRNDKILDKKGQLLCKDGNSSFYLFNEQLQQMQKMLKNKSMGMK